MRDQAISAAGKTDALWYEEMSIALRHLKTNETKVSNVIIVSNMQTLHILI